MAVKAYVLVSTVMVAAFIFLAAVLASPYKSILLPVNIPVGFNFESVQIVPAGSDVIAEGSYQVVLSGQDGKELVVFEPEEARSALQITATDLNHSGKLVWGSSNNLNLSAGSNSTEFTLQENDSSRSVDTYK